MLAPRQHQGVNNALDHNRRLSRALQLGIEEDDIKARIVCHERRIVDEG
jgi:hypothetical protein